MSHSDVLKLMRSKQDTKLLAKRPGGKLWLYHWLNVQADASSRVTKVTQKIFRLEDSVCKLKTLAVPFFPVIRRTSCGRTVILQVSKTSSVLDFFFK